MQKSQKDLPRYEQVVFDPAVREADEVMFDMESHEMFFFINEGGALVCRFEPNVIGTELQLFEYYKDTLRKLFPHKRIEIRPSRRDRYYLIRNW